jgi:hypothetical protein
VRDATTALSTNRMFDADPEVDTVPFLSTPSGVHGDDMLGGSPS